MSEQLTIETKQQARILKEMAGIAAGNTLVLLALTPTNSPQRSQYLEELAAAKETTERFAFAEVGLIPLTQTMDQGVTIEAIRQQLSL